jgi:chorismate mutase
MGLGLGFQHERVLIQSGPIDAFKNSIGRNFGATGQNLKGQVFKWTQATPENEKAWKKAVAKYKQVYGNTPQTAQDVRLVFKTAKKFVGQENKATKQVAKQVANSNPLGGQTNYDPRAAQQMFQQLKQWYDAGSLTQDQINKIFQCVSAGFKPDMRTPATCIASVVRR